MQAIRFRRGGREAAPKRREPIPTGRTFSDLVFREKLSRKRPVVSSSSTKANRSQGRDAKPRASGFRSAGSLAAERVKLFGKRWRERLVVF